MRTRKKGAGIFNLFMICMIIFSLLSSELLVVKASEVDNAVFINEIESNDAVTDIDWIEIINTGNSKIDVSGWFVSDDKGLERVEDNKEWRIPEGTVLAAGEILVVEHDVVLGNLSLGKNDTVSLYDNNEQLVDTYSYTGHAVGTYSRVPDGTGDFIDQEPTKNALNIVEKEELPEYKLVINEINSAPDDWVELMNLGTGEIDLSNYEIRDNSNDHRFKFSEGTKLAAGGLIVVDANTQGLIYDDQAKVYIPGEFQEAIGIGSGDSIRLYDRDGDLLDDYSWTKHASYEGDESKASYGRYPDGTGSFVLTKETKGAKNEWYQPQVVINEVESNDDETDWVEVYNVGNTPVDLSGWYLYDDDPVGHAADITPVAEGTMLNPGEFYVFDQNKHFTFGLGKNDKATIFNQSGLVIAEYAWEVHAEGVYARIPDGVGDFVDFPTSTKGKANIATNPVVINEIQSNDANGGADWVELANPTNEVLDISGIVMKDNNDANQYVFAEGTTIDKNGFLVITEDEFGFGLGKNDAVRLFENGRLIAHTTWTDHTNPTWGLYPNVNGNEFRNTIEETPGAPNKFEGIPDVIEWPGNGEVEIYDNEPMFLEDSSGLDFHNGQLYAVDNGTGKFWILDVAIDGALSFAEGFENGKRVRFQNDADNPRAAGPDAEGITVDKDGFVYIASERDNSVKGVNFNMILKVDPNYEAEDLIALQQWDLTASLPQVSANMGIEAVEWVSNADVEGKLYDENTKAAFDASHYPNAIANGVFFVALEDNGHVYAYVLNEDESFVQIADINGKLGGAMALDYDTYEDVLWVVADNGYNNRSAKITLNGKKQPDIVHVMPASGVDINANNEGFAIAAKEYTKNGQRPVYRFKDGDKVGSLSIGSIATKYNENETGNGGTIISGDPVWQHGSKEDLVIVVDVDYTKFKDLYIADKKVDKEAYRVESGSTTITLLNSYLATLAEGEYPLSIEFTDEVVNAQLTILAEADTNEENKPNPTDPEEAKPVGPNNNEENKTSEQDKEKKGNNNEKLPNTSTTLYTNLVLGLILLGLGVATYLMRRDRTVQ